MMTLAITTLTTAATHTGITSIAETSAVSDRLKPALPRFEYSVLDDALTEVRAGLVKATRDENKEYRKRRRYTRILQVRCVLAAETEVAVEGLFKTFLKKLPKHVKDTDGIDVSVVPKRAERKNFIGKLVDVFPQKEIIVFIAFVGGIYTDEEVNLIKDVTITPEVQ